uniref:Uncharacterized protein n=1 Tax=Oryza punctata TaxID=4537 RepID=A0A0E0MM88_ORYPU
MVTPNKKRRKKLAAAEPTPTPAPAPRTRSKKSKGASSPDKQPPPQPPVYMVLAHGDEEEPTTHSVIEVSAGAAAHRLLNVSGRGMSFASVGTRIVGVSVQGTTVYDPETSTERRGPRLFFPKANPVLISISDDGNGGGGGGGKL